MDAAMNSAVSALTAQSAALSNISNNLSNSGTTGYKAVTTNFIDLLTPSNSATTISSGGVLATARQDVTAQGQVQNTSVSTNMAIDGNGLFVVSDGTASSGDDSFTRNGSFSPDSQGNLQLAGTNYYLQGWPVNSAGVVTGASSTGTSSLTTVNLNTKATASATTTFTMQANLPAEAQGDIPTLASQSYTDASGATQTLPETWSSAGPNEWTLTVGPSSSFSASGTTLSDANGNASNASGALTYTVFTNASGAITGWQDAAAAAASPPTTYPASTAMPAITASDAGTDATTGAANTVTLPTVATLSTGLSGVFSSTTTASIVDSLGTSQNVPLTWTATGLNASGQSTWLLTVGAPKNGSGTQTGTLASSPNSATYSYDVTFDSTGANPTYTPVPVTDSTGATVYTPPVDASGNPMIDVSSYALSNSSAAASSVSLNLGKVTQQSSGETTPSINITQTKQDGVQNGSLTGVAIDKNGYVVATYSNGQSTPIYKIPVATFPNEDGLSAQTDGVYQQTATSGNYTLNSSASNGAGTVEGGSLESSNVDTSTEFANMITAQQAYSAASQIIGTDKQMFSSLIQVVQ
jgi:flagellar hook protein FlgE